METVQEGACPLANGARRWKGVEEQQLVMGRLHLGGAPRNRRPDGGEEHRAACVRAGAGGATKGVQSREMPGESHVPGAGDVPKLRAGDRIACRDEPDTGSGDFRVLRQLPRGARSGDITDPQLARRDGV